MTSSLTRPLPASPAPAWGVALAALSRAWFVGLAAAALAIQGALWIGLPLAFEGSIRLDVAEGVIDGPAWRLSYPVHPPLSEWLAGVAWTLGPARYAALYAIAFALACGAFALVAAFLARVDSRGAATVALAAGLASPFATYVPLQLNHNIGLMPFWAAAIAAGWFAFEEGSLLWWAAFGAAVGGGLWAKYAIAHVVAPLAVLFFVTPQWRRKTLTPGPWLALALAAAIAAPHVLDAWARGGSTLQYAAHTTPSSAFVRARWAGEFALDALLVQAPMALVALAAGGPWRLVAGLGAMIAGADRFDRFVAVAAFGPVALILAAAALGVQPHYFWITAPALGFALWWGRAAARGGLSGSSRRLASVAAALSALTVISYIGLREIGPRVASRPPYADMDGPALAALAERYWAERMGGPIPYIVTLDSDHGMQAAGSIAFDLDYRAPVMRDANPVEAPWIDIADLKRRGALVVVTHPLAPGAAALGVEIAEAADFVRPLRRGASPERIVFGVLPPKF